MIDDITLSTAIVNNPQMKVEFNTNAQSTRLKRTGIGCFIKEGNREQFFLFHVPCPGVTDHLFPVAGSLFSL
ncbi:hypothetical protein [Nostoc sp.]|uniref:hypothetical protein n=1 Tax=Nostoc sp. TaxID=1180 RepID=UPI002FF398F2